DRVLFGMEAAAGVEAGEKGEVRAIDYQGLTVALPDGRLVSVSPDAIEPVRQYAMLSRDLPDADAKMLTYFGAGDRVLFGKNDARLGVKNGTLGTVVSSARNKMMVKLDSGRTVRVDAAQYDSVTHGYAMTVHKSQGVTVDHTRTLVTAGWDKHLAYVGLSRHRKDVKVYYGDNSFARRSMDAVLGESRRQENILSFAAQRGLEAANGRFVIPPGSRVGVHGADNPEHFDQDARRDGDDYLSVEREEAEWLTLKVARDDAIFDLIEATSQPVDLGDPIASGFDGLTTIEQGAVARVLSGASSLNVIMAEIQRMGGLLALSKAAFEANGRRVIGLAGSEADARALHESSGIASQSISHWIARPNSLLKGDVVVLDTQGAVSAIKLIRTMYFAYKSGAQLILAGKPSQMTGTQHFLSTIARRTGFTDLGPDARGYQPAQLNRDEARARLVTQLAAVGLDLRDGRVHIIPDTELELRAKRAEIMLRETTTETISAATKPFDDVRKTLSRAVDKARADKAAHQHNKPVGLLKNLKMKEWVRRDAELTQAFGEARSTLSKFNDQFVGSRSPLSKIRHDARADAEARNPLSVAIKSAWMNRKARRDTIKR
ncbi:MAG: AAA family ATPase, partial [Burkholderiaceae bacterium]